MERTVVQDVLRDDLASFFQLGLLDGRLSVVHDDDDDDDDDDDEE